MLFLDFDGVLHRAENGSFEFMPQFERLLATHPEVDVVLSTNWRESCNASELLAIFPEYIRHRIVGANPVISDVFSRERECLAYVRAYAVQRFIAVDDDASLFTPACPFLFGTRRHWGLDDETTIRLSARISELRST